MVFRSTPIPSISSSVVHLGGRALAPLLAVDPHGHPRGRDIEFV
jgi:hypothetical protein